MDGFGTGEVRMSAARGIKQVSLLTGVFLLVSTSAWGVNRFRIGDGQLPLGSSGNVVGIVADIDQEIVGLSIALDFDPAKLRISEVRLGAGLIGLEPEFSDGIIDNARGELVHGIILSLTETIVERRIAAGEGVEVLRLVVDVIAEEPASTTLDLANAAGFPGRLNVMTDGGGNSVAPSPQLSDGVLALRRLLPVIKHIQGNVGVAGDTFLVVGFNFDQAGLQVTICGNEAEHRLLGDGQTLQVFAPACAAAGFAVLEICNSFGCDTVAEGFDYDLVGGRQAPGDCNGDGGLDLSDGVCLLSHLFLGQPAELPCDGAGEMSLNDFNGDARIDLSDGVGILVYLFQGGPAHAEGTECKVLTGCSNTCN